MHRQGQTKPRRRRLTMCLFLAVSALAACSSNAPITTDPPISPRTSTSPVAPERPETPAPPRATVASSLTTMPPDAIIIRVEPDGIDIDVAPLYKRITDLLGEDKGAEAWRSLSEHLPSLFRSSPAEDWSAGSPRLARVIPLDHGQVRIEHKRGGRDTLYVAPLFMTLNSLVDLERRVNRLAQLTEIRTSTMILDLHPNIPSHTLFSVIYSARYAQVTRFLMAVQNADGRHGVLEVDAPQYSVLQANTPKPTKPDCILPILSRTPTQIVVQARWGEADQTDVPEHNPAADPVKQPLDLTGMCTIMSPSADPRPALNALRAANAQICQRGVVAASPEVTWGALTPLMDGLIAAELKPGFGPEVTAPATCPRGWFPTVKSQP